jgi:hypothetical protein
MTFWRPTVRSLGSAYVGHLCATVLFDLSRVCQIREKKTASDLQHKNSFGDRMKSATAEQLRKRRQVCHLVSDVTWHGEYALVTQHATCLHYHYKLLTVLNAQAC